MKTPFEIRKSQIDFSLGKSNDIDIFKSGEGSRGGKVIGHTKSGKPIYASLKEFTSDEYKGYKHGNPSEAAEGIINSHKDLHEKLESAKHKAGSFSSPGLEFAYKKDLKNIHSGTKTPTKHLEEYHKQTGEDNEYRGGKSASKELIDHMKKYHSEFEKHASKAGGFLEPGVRHAAKKDLD